MRLQGLFEQYREAHDNANASACFGRLARGRYHEAASRPGYDPARKSIVSVFQPKSGGTYLHNRLLQLGYQEFWWLFPNRINHSVCFASDEALQYYLRGGFACHTHARPDPNILAALDRAGVGKIWVHVRNPAESVVSAYHHYLGEGHGEGEVGQQRRQEALDAAQRDGLVPGMTKSDFAVSAIAFFVEWVAQWLRYAEQHPDVVVLSYYRELADPHALLSRVFAELGAAPPGAVSAALAPQDRYRQKTTNNWRHDLTPRAQRYLETRVRADLEEFPAFAQLWS